MKTTETRAGRPRDEALRATRCDEILDTAASIFAEHGYQSTEMQFIADAMQIGKGTIYRYFPSKEELFLKSVSRGAWTGCATRYTPVATVWPSRWRSFTKAIYAYLAFFREHPEYVELLIQERAKFRDQKQNTYFEHREPQRLPMAQETLCRVDLGRAHPRRPPFREFSTW